MPKLKPNTVVRLKASSGANDTRYAFVVRNLDPEITGGLVLDIPLGGCRYWNETDVAVVPLSQSQTKIMARLFKSDEPVYGVQTTLYRGVVEGRREWDAVEGLIRMGLVVEIKRDHFTTYPKGNGYACRTSTLKVRRRSAVEAFDRKAA